jgi:drug/metabolite transporter (DMT)-like permease
MLLETILGPIWVWIFIKESPSNQMILGGMIVIITLLLYFLEPFKLRKS